MSEQPNQQENNPADSTQSDYKFNNVVALTQLVGTVVDYYSFKNKLIEDEDEVEKWKKGSPDEGQIIPSNIDSMIQKSFLAQLKKFTE